MPNLITRIANNLISSKDIYQNEQLLIDILKQIKRAVGTERDYLVAILYTGRTNLTKQEVVKYSNLYYQDVYII